MSDRLLDIYVVGYPRSGNTWFGRLLADILGCGYLYNDLGGPEFTGDQTDAPYVIHKSHAIDTPDRLHTVLIVRDPRDVAVSIAHYFGSGDVLMAVDAMTKPIDLWGVGPYVEFMRAWWYPHRAVCEVRYEDLHNRPFTALGDITAIFTGYAPTSAKVALALERQSIEVSRKKYPPTNGTRNGKTGEWRTAFTAEAAREFNRHFGQLLIDQGYEVDDRWLERYA